MTGRSRKKNDWTLIVKRCKGTVLDSKIVNGERQIRYCECRCQTHYLYKGIPVRFGQDPPKSILTEQPPEPISDEKQQSLDDWKESKKE